MLTIPSSIKALYQRDGVLKNFRVHFPNGEFSDITNENVVQESLHFTESLCSQSVFKFGLAEASVIEFETVGVGNMYGMIIEASIEIDTSSLSAADISAIQADEGDGTLVLASASDIGYGFYRIPIGTFKVQSCPRNHGAMAHRQVTAYTIMENNLSQFPNMPSTLLYPKIQISSEAFLANATQSAEFHDSVQFRTAFTGQSGYLYNSSKKATTVAIELLKNGTIVQSNLVNWCSVYNYTTLVNTDHWMPSYVEAVGADYDYEKHYKFGQRVAKAITDAGYDYTYNSKGVKVFANNEAALLFNYPYFFYPCLYYGYRHENGYYYTDLSFAQKIVQGQLVPIIGTNHLNAALFPSAFKTEETKIYTEFAYIATCADLTGEDDIDFRTTLITTSVVNLPTFKFDAGIPTILPTINRYGLPSYGTMLTINSEATGEMLDTVGPNGNMSLQSYNYSIPYKKITEGILELNAQFLKMGRNGVGDILRLSKLSPQAFYPSDYSEMWWDEYDISPIGTVMVMFNVEDAENAVALTISGGTSVYDMTDNEAISYFSNGTVPSVFSVLMSTFEPYAGDVGFTPTELTMRGYPWLEAGDALEATAEDGTVVETYALRVEMSGIQHLTMVITAEGGEIYEEVS